MQRGFWTKLAIGSVGLFLSASPAAAEWQFVPLVGVTFNADTTLPDLDSGASVRHKNLGGAVRWLSSGIFGVEAIGLWVPGFFGSDAGNLVKESRVVSIMGNVIITAPRRWSEYNLRPFVSGGVGFLRPKSTEFKEVFSYEESFNAFNLGAGAVGFFSQRTGVQFDLRYYRTMRGIADASADFGETRLSFMTASVGVVIRR
ncbi:MAG: outer membrane beta-barrel protein [Vicinamibacterales bacterium]